MKVRLTLDLELPDVVDPNVNLQEEYVPGITWEKAHIIQDVFDNVVNFAICQHLRDRCEWADSKLLANHHKRWADILRKAEPSMKIDIL